MAALSTRPNLQVDPGVSDGGVSHEIREQAVERLNEKREFHAHVLVYVLINAVMVGIWAVFSGVHSDFWPAYLMVIWGFWVALDAMKLYGPSPIRFATELLYARKPLSEKQIDREAARLQRHRDKVHREATRLEHVEHAIRREAHGPRGR